MILHVLFYFSLISDSTYPTSVTSQKHDQITNSPTNVPCSTPKKRRLTDAMMISSSRSPSVSSPVYPSSSSNYSLSSPLHISSPPPSTSSSDHQLLRLSSDPEDLSVQNNSCQSALLKVFKYLVVE